MACGDFPPPDNMHWTDACGWVPNAPALLHVIDEFERAAADLWRQENPTKSVFDCDHAERERYRARVRASVRARVLLRVRFKGQLATTYSRPYQGRPRSGDVFRGDPLAYQCGLMLTPPDLWRRNLIAAGPWT